MKRLSQNSIEFHQSQMSVFGILEAKNFSVNWGDPSKAAQPPRSPCPDQYCLAQVWSKNLGISMNFHEFPEAFPLEAI